MRIALDLDDTVIPGRQTFPVEPLPPMRRWLAGEPLRAGVPASLRRLQGAGHEVWVYTSSYRSHFTIRLLFFMHGVWLDGVINEADHDRALSAHPHRHTKYPPAFGIDLIFDDSVAVLEQAQALGYRAILVGPETDLVEMLERLR